ncbi:recombinase family protein, partial [Mycobacterium ostraviense]|uniref:recombinase family protein n=1 Tax=Mycobacterium ostraviense TaxID=2738409 RepID=UPI00278C8264
MTFGPVRLGLVPVTVTHQVIGYLRRRLSGEVIDFIELDLPEHVLPTNAVMFTITADTLQRADLDRQVSRLIEWASDAGWEVGQVVSEVGSGLNGKRPKLSRILSDPSA